MYMYEYVQNIQSYFAVIFLSLFHYCNVQYVERRVYYMAKLVRVI
jgi:hypothetical protein